MMLFKPLVKLGQVVATPGSLEALERDGATIGEFMDDFYTGDDSLYDDVAEELEGLIEEVGDQTPISAVLGNPSTAAPSSPRFWSHRCRSSWTPTASIAALAS